MSLINPKEQIQEKTKVPAAFYARYSGKKQNKLSCDEQIDRGLDMAERGEVRLVKYPFSGHQLTFLGDHLIKDEAKSGRTTMRYGYELMLQLIREQRIKVVIVDDLSRVCRELGAQVHFYQLLKFHGVELFSICDGISSEDPDAYTLFAIKGIINDAGNKTHALRTKRGLEMRAAKGFSTGDICYGYHSEATGERPGPSNEKLGAYYKIMINPKEAEIVRLVFDLKLGVSSHPDALPSQMGNANIARFLNEHQVPSSMRSQKMSGKLCNWSPSGIQHLLRQEKYIGIWRWNKTTQDIDPDTQRKVIKSLPQNKWITHGKDAEGKETLQTMDGARIRKDLIIISPDKWNSVQALIHKEKTKRTEEIPARATRFGRPTGIATETLLSGILFCGICGSLMHQISGTKGGFFGCYNYYRRSKLECKNGRLLSRRRIEPKVLDLVRSVLLDPKVIEESVTRINKEIKKRLTQNPDELVELEQKIGTTDKALKNLLSIAMNSTTPELLDETAKTIQQKEWELRALRDRFKTLKDASNNTEKLFLTPFALKARYESLSKYLEQDPTKANGALRLLFPEGLKATSTSNPKRRRCDPRDNGWTIEGVMLIDGGGMGRAALSSGDYQKVDLKI